MYQMHSTVFLQRFIPEWEENLSGLNGTGIGPILQEHQKEQMDNKRVFVGNLSFETTKEEINELFSAFGKVDTISLRPKKGFAFVSMSKPEEAIAVIDNLDQTEFKDRPLRIAFELPKNKARKVTRARRKETVKKGDEENYVD